MTSRQARTGTVVLWRVLLAWAVASLAKHGILLTPGDLQDLLAVLAQ